MWLKSTKPAKRVEIYAFVVSFTMFKKEFELYEILCLSRFTNVCQCKVMCVQILLVLVLVFLCHFVAHIFTPKNRQNSRSQPQLLNYTRI